MRHPTRRLLRGLSFAFVVTVFAGCGGGASDGVDLAAIDAAIEAAPVARSAGGVVAAAQPLAARAGARMLALGGNAVDAAVASAFALSVVEPTMSGLGGRAQILIRLPDGRHVGIDGTTQAPDSYNPDTAPQAGYGYPTVGVPGVPAALLRALEEHGSLDRATVMQPAIDLAENGFELLPMEAARHAAAADEIAEFEGTAASFLNAEGTTRAAGERWVQPDLARTLRALAEGGHDAFYRGEIAEAIAADMQANGGAVTLESLAAYEAESSEIVTGSYRGHELIGLWLPSYGAITIEILQLLETLDLAALDEADWALAVAEAIRVGYLDRPEQRTLDDAARLTSKAWAAERAPMMRVGAGMGAAVGAAQPAAAPLPDPAPTDPAPAATDPAHAATGPAPAPTPATLAADGHTTHLTTADRSGMVVALTQSLGPNLGSKVITPGLGFVYAATLGGYLGRMEPGERARSHISPFMVERDGVPFLALGAAGGGRIPTAIVAAISRVIDRDHPLAEALQAPRIVPEFPSQSEGGDPEAETAVEIELETGLGFDSTVVAALRDLGIEVEPIDRSGAFGRIHAVRWHPDTGEWEGAADPDWEGVAAVPGGG
ncbi:gamma-glutamyltransferase [Gemmatimonadota bacterium Y43]|uniref:gamma-glutamyltransferase family protein n=1 Tax=Gaopeijia maritima TaxID=3119007 RepID=UPI00327C382C